MKNIIAKLTQSLETFSMHLFAWVFVIIMAPFIIVSTIKLNREWKKQSEE